MADPRPAPGKTPAIAMLNPTANGGQAAALRRPVVDWLARHAPGVPLLVPGSVHEARAMLTIVAVRTRVVLIGGDGTLGAMLPALLKGGLRVGLVPAGRRNRTARTLGLDVLSIEQALMYALRARTGPVDVGLIETDHTTSHFIAEVHLDATPAQPLLSAAPEMSLWIDGQRTRPGTARVVRVCNALPEATAPAWAAQVALDDGTFDILSWSGQPGWQRLLGPVGRLGLPTAADPALAQHQQGHAIMIEAQEPMAIDIDGEPQLPGTRIHIDLLPRALDLTGSHVISPRDPQRFVDTVW